MGHTTKLLLEQLTATAERKGKRVMYNILRELILEKGVVPDIAFKQVDRLLDYPKDPEEKKTI